MHYSQREKYEIIQLVEQSDLGVNRTLRELKVNKTTFYNWYNAYVEMGFDGLARKASKRTGSWNKINMADRDKVVEIATTDNIVNNFFIFNFLVNSCKNNKKYSNNFF